MVAQYSQQRLWTPKQRTPRDNDQFMVQSLRRNLQFAAFLEEPAGDRRERILGLTLTDNATVTSNPGPSSLMPLASQFTRANSEYLNAPDVAQHSFVVDMTAICWVYVDSKPAAEMQIFAKDGTTSGTREYGLFLTNATDRFRWAQGNTGWTVLDTVDANVLGSPATATWYMIEADVDTVGGVIGIRTNNGARTTASKTTTMADGTQGLTIGARGGATPALFFDGRIAGLLLWNRLLTDPERTWLYNTTKGIAPTRLGI